MNPKSDTDITRALDDRIDAGLRRRFEPKSLRFDPPGGEVPARPVGGSLHHRPVLAAAATVAVLVGTWFVLTPRTPIVEEGKVSRADVSSWTPVTTKLLTAGEAAIEVHSNELYADAVNFPSPTSECNDRSSELSMEVEAKLGLQCGAQIALDSDVATRLSGPIPSDSMPSATILRGYPNGVDEPPVVLVAECSDFKNCCIDLVTAEGGGLQHFSREVDGIWWTEITPYAEPFLLDDVAEM